MEFHVCAIFRFPIYQEPLPTFAALDILLKCIANFDNCLKNNIWLLRHVAVQRTLADVIFLYLPNVLFPYLNSNKLTHSLNIIVLLGIKVCLKMLYNKVLIARFEWPRCTSISQRTLTFSVWENLFLELFYVQSRFKLEIS